MIESLDLPPLPEGWVWTKVREIGQIISGQTPKGINEHGSDGKIPYFKVGDMNKLGNETYMFYSDIALDPDVIDKLGLRIQNKGTVIFPKRGGAIGTNKKRILAQPSAYDLNIMGVCPVIMPYLFFYYWILSVNLITLSDGSNVPQINHKDVEPLRFPLPPLPEQHRIVTKTEELFTKLDAGVESLEKTKAQLKRYRQAVLKYAFEGKLTEEWRETHKDELEPASELLERIKEERKKTLKEKYKELPPQVTLDLPVLPKGGVWTTLGLCSKEIYRYPTFYGISHLKEGIPVIRGEHIRERGSISHDWGNYWYVSEDISNNFKRTILEFKDLIMSVRGSVGKIGFVDDVLSGAQISPNCIRISLFKNYCNPKYILNYLKSITGQGFIKGFVNATTIQTIKASLIIQIPIPLLPLPEQHKIAEEIELRFSVADDVEKTVDQSLKQAERLRHSILKTAFEGKLMPQDPTDEPASVLLERIKAEREKREIEAKSKSKNKRKRDLVLKQRRFNDYVE